MEMLSDINKDTVDFVPNFDETEKEPTVLPSRYPNLLVNGTSGIAVGMATNIPPHNLREVIGAVVKIIDNRIEEDRETSIEEVMDIIKGPDFPTGAEILGRRGIEEAYRTGRGKIKVRAVTNIEPMQNGKQRIIVTELPYMVNKSLLITKIADLVKAKKVDGITDLRDESSREGMRIVIELRRDANPNVILNSLYKHTQLQDTFGAIMLALVNNEPKVMNILDMLKYYLKHQEEVVTRRTKYDLKKAEERAHILEGLLKAIDNIDEVIKIIRGSANVTEAKAALIERFELSDVQAQAIVDMRLRALTGLEREKLEAELAELMQKIAEYKAILADEKKLLGVIKEEISIISDKYGDERRTTIGHAVDDIEDEDLIKKENVVITMTHLGYIKRMTEDNFHAQNRGGKGIKGMQTIEDDFIEDILMTSTHNHVLFFTNKGRTYMMKAYKIPEASRTARGVAIVNLLNLEAEEKVTAMIAIKEFIEEKYLVMVTKKGYIKKCRENDFSHIRTNGLIAITLRDDDELIEVKTTDNTRDIYMVSAKGMSIHFKDTDIRTMGRTAMGVKAMRLDEDDEIVGMQLSTQGEALLTVTEMGMGKRTRLSEFRIQGRAGKGIKCHRINEKTGRIVGVKAVNNDHEIMLITNQGVIIRIKCGDISIYGRNSSGVKVMRIDKNEDVRVAGIAKVRKRLPDDSGLIERESLENDSFENDSLENESVTDESLENESDDNGSEA